MSSSENKQKPCSSTPKDPINSEVENTAYNINSTLPNSDVRLHNVEKKVFLSAKQQYNVYLAKQIGETKQKITKLKKQKQEIESQLQRDIKKKNDLEKKQHELMTEIEDFKTMITSLHQQITEI